MCYRAPPGCVHYRDLWHLVSASVRVFISRVICTVCVAASGEQLPARATVLFVYERAVLIAYVLHCLYHGLILRALLIATIVTRPPCSSK